MLLNKSGLQIVKEFEGCRLLAYPDPATGGEPWTIGYGSTRNADGNPFKKGDIITKDVADKLLSRDYNAVLSEVKRDVNLQHLPAECQDAIACLCYNIKGGFGAFKKSNCYRAIVNKDIGGIFHNWDWGVSQKGVELGLSRRRACELLLFLDNFKRQ